MKKLPHNPSLTHLRQQAKDLLPDLRSVRPEASLADAQSSLAEQYGFHTWSDLKSEVDRRRGAVEVADPELASTVAGAFGLGDVLGPMSLVERGAMARVWSLETASGRCAVRELFDWVNIGNAETDVRLLEAAVGAGVRAPTPVRSASGKIVEALGGRNWRVYKWMKLGPAPSQPVGASTAAEMGRILAKLHGLALVTPEGVSPWLTYRQSRADWEELQQRATAGSASWARVLVDALPTLVDLATIASNAAAVSPILCHCNLVPGNVRAAERNTLAILDWENAGALPALWELGYVLVQWTTGTGDEVDEAAAHALTAAYRAETGMMNQLDLSIFATAISSILNWTASRVAAALDNANAEEQGLALRELPKLLGKPLSRAKLEKVLSAANQAVDVLA